MKVLRRPARDPAGEPLAEPGRGRRRMALVVPVVAVVCGLVAGGVAGERVVGRRPVAAVAAAGLRRRRRGPAGRSSSSGGGDAAVHRPGGARPCPGGRRGRAGAGPARRAGVQAGATGPRPGGGRAPAGRPARRALGRAGPRRRPGVPADRHWAAAVGRLLDGSLRSLVPAGWRSPGPPRHSADGSVIGVCGYRLGGDPFPAVTEATSWVLDGSGTRLATLPGCLYDVAADGGSALVADPAEGQRAGPVPGREFLRRPRWASPTSSPGACGCGGATASARCSASPTWSGSSGPSSPGSTRAAWSS